MPFKPQGKWLTYAISACCCSGFLLIGYDQGVMSGIIGADNDFGNYFNNPSPTMQGTIVGIYNIGCAAGSIATFVVGEALGRRRTIMTGTFIMLIGIAILTSSTTRAQLLVGRVITGFGKGCNASSIPVYQSETCRGPVRGALLCLNTAVTVVGFHIAYWLDYGLSFVDGPVQWRLPLGFQATFALLLLLQAWLLPESPRWLLAHGNEEEATNVLARLADEPNDSPSVLKKRDEVRSALALESIGGPFKYKELFQGGKIGNFRRIILCIAAPVMQQFSGANMINYLAPVIYQQAMGLSRNLALILGGGTALTFLASGLSSIWIIDRFGRRPILMLSAGGVSLCFAMAAILLSIGTKKTAYGATTMIFLFQVCFGIGLLGIPWLYPSEISTTRIRARGGAISSFFNWISVFAIVQFAPPAIANIGWRVFIIFAVLNAFWVPIVYLFFPETMGLELEDIDHIFEKGGITGGIWGAPGGRTVVRGVHRKDGNFQDEGEEVVEKE